MEKHVLKRILNHFPSHGLRFAVGYGSGVIPQVGYEEYSRLSVEKKPLIDFIFGVDSSLDWHRQNLEINSNHYSFLKWGGPQFITSIQEKYGASIYFNTHVLIEDDEIGAQMIKYGVISLSDLEQDMVHWKHLYTSGRLHKPVETILTSDIIQSQQQENLDHALRVSLLLLPESFSEIDLFEKIAGISYLGDVRMQFAENPNKVRNIVGRNKDRFHHLYAKSLQRLHDVVMYDKEKKLFYQNKTEKNLTNLILCLPSNLLHIMESKYKAYNGERNMKVNALLKENYYQPLLKSSISSLNNRYSKSQTFKGFFTAGISKSIIYSTQKFLKRFKRQ